MKSENRRAASSAGTIAPLVTLEPSQVLDKPSGLTEFGAIDLRTIDIARMMIQSKRSPNTRRAYETSLRAFFGENYTVEGVHEFLQWPPPQISFALRAHKIQMLAEGSSESGINRRMAAVKSLLDFAWPLGLSTTDGRNLVENERVQTYRDTRGISLEQIKKLLAAPEKLHGKGTLRCLRDTAILRLFCEVALRRGALNKMNVGDFSLNERCIWVLEKGQGTQKHRKTLSGMTTGAIAAYLLKAGHGGEADGALFRNISHRPDHAGGRLTGDGICHIVKTYQKAVGADRLRPHGLRHAAITAALDAGVDVRDVQRLSGHKDLRVLTVYDDNRKDLQGQVTNILSGLFDQIEEKPKKGRARK